MLSSALDDILSHNMERHLIVPSAMRTIMSTLWPHCFRSTISVPQLHMYFGEQTYPEAVEAHVVWTYPCRRDASPASSVDAPRSTQAPDSQPNSMLQNLPTLPPHFLTGHPMVCYVDKTLLTPLRRDIAPGPNGQYNEPVFRLRQLRVKKMTPEKPDEDAYTAGLMLAMAQMHFYAKGVPPGKGAESFTNIKMRLITHDCETSEFIVYTGHFTATFLERFRWPHKVPIGNDIGLGIDYVRVPIWPILGLRERLGKALGEDLVGPFDHEAMESWEKDTAVVTTSSGKRKRGALDGLRQARHAAPQRAKVEGARDIRSRDRLSHRVAPSLVRHGPDRRISQRPVSGPSLLDNIAAPVRNHSL